MRIRKDPDPGGPTGFPTLKDDIKHIRTNGRQQSLARCYTCTFFQVCISMKERHAAELIQTKSSTSAEPPALASIRMPADSSHRPTTISASAVDPAAFDEADSVSAAVKAVPTVPHLKDDLADASTSCSSLPSPLIEERSRPCPPLSITETAKPDSTTSTPEVIGSPSFSFLPRVIFLAWTTRVVSKTFLKDFSERRGKRSLRYHRMEWNWEGGPCRQRKKWGIKIEVSFPVDVAEPEP